MTSAYPSPISKSTIEPAPVPTGERSGGGPRAPGVGIISRHAVSEEEVGVAELLRERAARIVGDVRRGSALKPSCFLLGRPSRVPSLTSPYAPLSVKLLVRAPCFTRKSSPQK